MSTQSKGYFVERNGHGWQSVFPEKEAECSQLHATVEDAIDYMVNECGVVWEHVEIKGA